MTFQGVDFRGVVVLSHCAQRWLNFHFAMHKLTEEPSRCRSAGGKSHGVSFYPYGGARVLLQAAGVDDAFFEDADRLVKLLTHVVQVIDGL